MAITFHKDSTTSLGSFIQVLASGRPSGGCSRQQRLPVLD